jgi:ATP-binding cassette subfamily F protein 3
MLVRFDQVKISFSATELLAGASFQINPGDRVGLIGQNGSGKTTVLRLIARQLSPDSGEVALSSQLQIGYLEQLVHAESGATVIKAAEGVFVRLLDQEREIEELNHRIADPACAATHDEDLSRLSDVLHQFEVNGGYSFRAQAERVLMGLGFSKVDFERSCGEISGGQMNRLNLARLLLSEPNLLLLDEPTNHLDLDAVSWLEEFLHGYAKAFLVVSHDRYFLNRVVKRIFELERGAVHAYSGNYSAYQKQKILRVEQEKQAYELQQEWIEKTEDFVRRNIAGQKTKQAQSRRKMLAKVERLERPVDSEASARFDFHVTLPSAHRVLEVERGVIGYGNNAVSQGIELKLFRGDRYGIIGKNGTGKSTFLKTICRKLSPLAGAWIVGERVHLGYYDQTLGNLNSANSVFEELGFMLPSATDGELRSFAARFLFRGDEVFQRVENLSGGEKSRLTLAKIISLRPNFLVLDEPTNHLDIASREALEEALCEYDGTLLVVTHDRFLLERLVTRLLVFGEGGMEIFDGPYSDYAQRINSVRAAPLEDTAGRAKTRPAVKAVPVLTLSDVPTVESQGSQAGRRANTNRQRRRSQDLARLEEEIAKLEAELRDVETHLADSASYSDPKQIKSFSESYQNLTEQLNRLYEEWAALSEEDA